MSGAPGPGHNRLALIDPERLMRVDIEDISPLLTLQYRALIQRTADLEAKVRDWIKQHTPEGAKAPIIADDFALAKLTDLFAQVRDHAGDKGEIDVTREKVKAGPLAAGRAIDAHFGAQRAALALWMLNATELQKAYFKAKAPRPGGAPAKVQSTLGTTTSAVPSWTFEVTDLRAVCRAIADGILPSACVQVDHPMVRQLLRAKPPLRNVEGQDIGLRIYQDVQIRRRG